MNSLILSCCCQAERSSHVIRFVHVSSKVVTTLAGTRGISGHADGIGNAVMLAYPREVALDDAGGLGIIVSASRPTLLLRS